MRVMSVFALSIVLSLLALRSSAAPIAVEFPPGLQVPAEARPGPGFDVDKATAAYLAMLTPGERARSDAYFEGGYWLQLWNWLYGVALAAVVLLSGLSRWIRDFARRVSPRPWLHTLVYGAIWIVAGFVLTLPFTIYAGFLREHEYGLSEQPFLSWLGDRLKALGVGLILGSIVIAGVYAALRRAGARWWIWATALVFAFNVAVGMIAPVFIAPLFNHYQPLPDGPVRDAVLSLARANQIPTDHVEWFDASKQTTRISANVSGLWGTTRLSLNDNLLEHTSLPEIKAVLGHEMGHYVLSHTLELTVYLTIVFGAVFWIARFAFDRALLLWGARFGVRDRGDPAGLPLLVAIVTTLLFLATPILNGIVRSAENQADAYGLNAAREPYGFAMVSMRLATYRKIMPGPVEELLFFDHPSGYERVHRAMVWLRENMSPRLSEEAAKAQSR
ncbi:MAG TPA: M48 family metallopeptidase [Usitatibacter sp.]|nr:M48 family metallopeptidase [Usitatibacter sp.]